MQKTNRDWKNYNTSLVNRGSINFWLDEEALSKWTGVFPNSLKGPRSIL
jgi:hypothetical protein